MAASSSRSEDNGLGKGTNLQGAARRCRMSTIAIELPERLSKQLRQELVSDDEVSEVVTEAIERWLENRRQKAKSEQERIREALRSTGLLSEMGEEWNDLIAQAPRMTHDEIQQMMAGTPPLSEIIIAEREEGR
jgi:Arc/MetJ-type ribon-helix-helix transcriptional regulator